MYTWPMYWIDKVINIGCAIVAGMALAWWVDYKDTRTKAKVLKIKVVLKTMEIIDKLGIK